MFYYQGDFAGARKEYQQSAADCRAREAAAGGVDGPAESGERVMRDGGRAPLSAAALETLGADAERLGLKFESVYCSLLAGDAERRAKRYAAARDRLESTLGQADRLGARALLAQAHHLLSMIYAAKEPARVAAPRGNRPSSRWTPSARMRARRCSSGPTSKPFSSSPTRDGPAEGRPAPRERQFFTVEVQTGLAHDRSDRPILVVDRWRHHARTILVPDGELRIRESRIRGDRVEVEVRPILVRCGRPRQAVAVEDAEQAFAVADDLALVQDCSGATEVISVTVSTSSSLRPDTKLQLLCGLRAPRRRSAGCDRFEPVPAGVGLMMRRKYCASDRSTTIESFVLVLMIPPSSPP